MTFRLPELAAEMSAAAAAYDPESMLDVERHLRALPDALSHVANATRVTVARAAEEWPIHGAVLELLAQVYQLQMQAAQAGAEVGPAFRRLHEADLNRHEQPRKGERKWNVPG